MTDKQKARFEKWLKFNLSICVLLLLLYLSFLFILPAKSDESPRDSYGSNKPTPSECKRDPALPGCERK